MCVIFPLAKGPVAGILSRLTEWAVEVEGIGMTRIIIAGIAGRMGRTLAEAVAMSDLGLELVGGTVLEDDPALGKDIGLICGTEAMQLPSVADLESIVARCDVVIDFTSPQATANHLSICERNGKGIVIGTTGMGEQQLAALAAAGAQIPVMYSPNYSVGVNLCLELLDRAARVLGDDVDIEIVEAHHRHKKDAPSGTALRMGEVVASALDRDLSVDAIYGREGQTGERERKTIGFATIRAGDIVGDHTVIFAAPGERVEITHKASSRMTFASGAVKAAHWLVEKKVPGMYSMNDVLSLDQK